MPTKYSISQEICTRFRCALLCCGYVIVHNEFTWSIYPYSSGCFAGTGAIIRLPQCQWSKPDGYGKISQCITTTKHSKAKTVCIFLGVYYNKQPLYKNILFNPCVMHMYGNLVCFAVVLCQWVLPFFPFLRLILSLCCWMNRKMDK